MQQPQTADGKPLIDLLKGEPRAADVLSLLLCSRRDRLLRPGTAGHSESQADSSKCGDRSIPPKSLAFLGR